MQNLHFHKNISQAYFTRMHCLTKSNIHNTFDVSPKKYKTTDILQNAWFNKTRHFKKRLHFTHLQHFTRRKTQDKIWQNIKTFDKTPHLTKQRHLKESISPKNRPTNKQYTHKTFLRQNNSSLNSKQYAGLKCCSILTLNM